MDSFDFDPDPLGDDCLKHRGDINMLFYVVFMNDSPEFVSPNEEKAKQKMAELKEKYFEKNKWSFNNNRSEYKTMCYWHIHDVKGTL